MRIFLLLTAFACSAVLIPGCSKSVDIPKDPVQYDKERDGEPAVIGPGGDGAPGKGPKGKKGGAGVGVTDGAPAK